MKAKYVLIISYFYILLFVYAAISKLITFEAFQVQLTQSPLLSAYANIIAYLVLGAELLFALLLCIKTTRLLGLYLSYGLMVAFTLYIYLILNYSDFVPCSCGGILEKMGWTEHLWFNLIVSILGFVAVYILQNNTKKFYLRIIIITLISSVVLILLFTSSEYIIKKQNPFVRRYLPHGVIQDETLDLQVNSFYFSGFYKDNIYLGNYTAPLRYIEIDSLMQRQDYSITIDSINLAYSNLRFKTLYPHFYLADGTTPIIFKGVLNDLKKRKTIGILSYKDVYFSDMVPVDSTTIAFKGQSSQDYKSVLGLLNSEGPVQIDLNTNLLESTSDGVFDTDGILVYNKEYEKFIYTYYYKNKFIQTDNKLIVINEQSTIDTTQMKKISATKLSTGENKMTTPIKAINSIVVTHRNLLLIVSNSMGQNESRKMWRQASIVDVYDFVNNSYLGSFYINHLGDDKLSDLIITDHYLYGLFDRKLVRFKMAKLLIDKFY